MKILVTGHRGFIGSHLYKEAQRRGHDVVGLDRKTGQSLLKCDLPNDVKKVYHLAANANAQSSDISAIIEDNIASSARLFAHYGPKLVFASSAAVNYPYTPYAISKRTCEDLARIYGCAIVRLPNVYGEGGHSCWDKFREGSEFVFYGSGEQLRSYVAVEYAVNALLDAQPGDECLVQGEDLTVVQVSGKFHADGKLVVHEKARAFDIMDGRQIMGEGRYVAPNRDDVTWARDRVQTEKLKPDDPNYAYQQANPPADWIK